MNITEYVSGDAQIQIYNGKLTMLSDYGIAKADECIYRYLGENSLRPLTALIHPDDLELFLAAVEALKESRQHIIFRLRDVNECYRYMYSVLKYNTDIPNAVDIEFMDVMYIYERYKKRMANVIKYRKIMSLSENLYFEYYYEERIVNIFEYVNGRSMDLFCYNIDELYEEINHNPKFTSKQKLEFDALYTNLVNRVDNINLMVDGILFGIGRCSLKLNGGIIYRDDKKEMLVAVVTKMDYADAEREEKYYLTSYAIDTTTGVYNKRAINELARDLLAKAKDQKHYIIMMDLDDFKLLNDTYGHMVGDIVLAKVADIMKSVIGERGYVGRFGGDEFFAIIDKMADDVELNYALKTIRRHIEWCCKDKVPDRKITTSIGVARYPDNGKEYDELFRLADICLYIAKAKGKNRYIVYNPEVHGKVEPTEKESRFGFTGLGDDSYKKCSVAYTVIEAMSKQESPEELDDVIEAVCEKFSLDGICVYKGPKLKRINSCGKYASLPEYADYLRCPEFQKTFDDNGVALINRILNLAERYPKVYEGLKKQGVSGYILVQEDDALVSFDIFDKRRKWSEMDKGLLMMVGKAMIRSMYNPEEL